MYPRIIGRHDVQVNNDAYHATINWLFNMFIFTCFPTQVAMLAQFRPIETTIYAVLIKLASAESKY